MIRIKFKASKLQSFLEFTKKISFVIHQKINAQYFSNQVVLPNWFQIQFFFILIQVHPSWIYKDALCLIILQIFQVWLFETHGRSDNNATLWPTWIHAACFFSNSCRIPVAVRRGAEILRLMNVKFGVIQISCMRFAYAFLELIWICRTKPRVLLFQDQSIEVDSHAQLNPFN